MPPLFKYPHFFIALMAFVIADVAVALLARLAKRIGAVDAPDLNTYKVQKQAVPFIGGIGLFIGFIGAVLASLDWSALLEYGVGPFLGKRDSQMAIAALIGGSMIAVLGLVDDFRPIGAVVKLGTLFAITLLLSFFGLTVNQFGWLPVIPFVITLFWVVGVVSAFNAIDNTDGVAGTTGVVISLFLFLVAWGTSAENAQPEQSRVSIALCGAILGFLRHNKPPAKVYLGNCGAFTLGFLVAVLAVSGNWTDYPIKSAVVPVMLLAYPIFDISYTVFLRWKTGIVRSLKEAIVVSGRDHTAHRLAAMGLGSWGVVAVVAVINGLGGLAAYGVVRMQHNDTAFWLLVTGMVLMYSSFGFVLRNAVNLRSEQARISHRVPTAKIKDASGGRTPSGRFKPITNSIDERNTRKVVPTVGEGGQEAAS